MIVLLRELLAVDGRLDMRQIEAHYRPKDDKDPFQTDIYTLKGDEVETFMPLFNYKGFQYAEVTADRPITLTVDNLTAWFMHNDVPVTGHIETSNPLINKIWEATNTAYLSNLFGYATDCPQREKWLDESIDRRRSVRTENGDAGVCSSGWWDYNGVSQASNVIVPESYVKKTLQNVEIGEDEESGKWSLDVMFGNALHIEKNMRQVIRDCGFQSEDASKPGYIAFGVNWGYTGAQSSSNLNAESIAAIVALLVLIVFTGYLVIYNVFQISVTNDIRFYGLLKTIGMTGRQLKRIIRLQAVLLSVIGIPGGTSVSGILEYCAKSFCLFLVCIQVSRCYNVNIAET